MIKNIQDPSPDLSCSYTQTNIVLPDRLSHRYKVFGFFPHPKADATHVSSTCPALVPGPCNHHQLSKQATVPPSYFPVMWHLILAWQLHDYQCGFWTGLTLNSTVRKTDPNREQSVATYQHWSWISPLCPPASCAAAWKRTRSERKGFLLDLCLAGMHCKIKTPMSVFTLYFFAFL